MALNSPLVGFLAPQNTILELISLQKEEIVKNQAILLGKVWFHSVEVHQDKIALLLIRKEESTGKMIWRVEIYQKV